MDVILQPPATARAGYPLQQPVIVRLRTINADADDALADSTNFYAVASLTPGGPNTTCSTDPTVLSNFLGGRRFDSVHPYSDGDADGLPISVANEDPRGVGYMYFPDLMIRQEGTYRIRVTLIHIRSTSGDAPLSPSSGGASVQSVESNPIIVQGNGPSTPLARANGDGEDDDGGWLEVLRTIQTRRRSRG
ncbi:hypothetical protein K469DRAFT_709891 [Zopfia rhizophila CBS 207.26]|uniref:Velvet domain-containing protein n=1 Tax=Zopfia rhizophila CBS 207.26 TaxID=1314779 RepID=A0A6A6DWR6_9PEZI|nr:hypothetical protein K469DRAFT_709891 [Zopfia rhizophila CBS 207.26]